MVECFFLYALAVPRYEGGCLNPEMNPGVDFRAAPSYIGGLWQSS